MSETSNRDKWRRFKRAEASMWHATMLYRGTAAKPGEVIKAAKLFREYFDDIYDNAAPIGDCSTVAAGKKAEAKEPIPNAIRVSRA